MGYNEKLYRIIGNAGVGTVREKSLVRKHLSRTPAEIGSEQ